MARPFTLFLCGDVMTGRGVDQILPHSVPKTIYEGFVKDASFYTHLAERKNGTISPKPVDYSYVWGDSFKVWEEVKPHAKIINLETAVTQHEEPLDGKGIHYRMHPGNVEVLKEAGIDCCVLANNHVLDWKTQGMYDTIDTLNREGIQTVGAGRNQTEAEAPATLRLHNARCIVIAAGRASSGIPDTWKATNSTPGISFVTSDQRQEVEKISDIVRHHKGKQDYVVYSVHWGGNWGYEIPEEQRAFAHSLIDSAGVDLVFGHSSHHPKAIEVYHNKLILYGAGDFINDYEGIENGGEEQYRGDLTLMYFPELEEGTGNLVRLRMKPVQIKKMCVKEVDEEEFLWIHTRMNREVRKFGHSVERHDQFLHLQF
eukprot:gb/GECG01014693.1/.p1 GENE.gb/GECG01014693.1/~~gb/GECG01014693.1/.p1  ORF type:complete len:371 (+),score=37.84 gb/GECG01014693.1/:1-1113(+)